MILQISLNISSQNLSEYSSRLALAQPEWTSTLVAKVLPYFREFVTVHEIIILLQGQVNCVLHMLFSVFKMLLLISWMSEAELSAKVQKTISPLPSAYTTSLPVITSLKGQHVQCSMPVKYPSLLVVCAISKLWCQACWWTTETKPTVGQQPYGGKHNELKMIWSLLALLSTMVLMA